MDPRVLQAAERVLAWARAQVIAGVQARLLQDGEPPAADAAAQADDDEGGGEGEAATPAQDAPLGH